MKELLIETLNDLTICGISMFGHVYLQGTIEAFEQYPDTFITFFTEETEDRSFYNNNVTSVDWDFSVILYSDDPFIVDEGRKEIVSALKRVGFIPQGKGRDILSGLPTHTGWVMEFIITEFINN